MFTIENFLTGLELLLDFKLKPKILFLIYLRQNDFVGCQNWKKPQCDISPILNWQRYTF